MDDKKPTKLLHLKEVAELFGVHMTTLRRWDKKGILKAVRIGDRRQVGDRRYRLEDVQKLITKNK